MSLKLGGPGQVSSGCPYSNVPKADYCLGVNMGRILLSCPYFILASYSIVMCVGLASKWLSSPIDLVRYRISGNMDYRKRTRSGYIIATSPRPLKCDPMTHNIGRKPQSWPAWSYLSTIEAAEKRHSSLLPRGW